MFWIAICFLLFLIWGGTSAIKAAANYRPPMKGALNPQQERIKFNSAVYDANYACENRIKEKMKLSDIWDFLEREPTEEEVKALNDPRFLWKKELVCNALMSREGKLDSLFVLGQKYPTTDQLQRALIDEIYLKIEDTLEARGIHNVVSIKRDWPKPMTMHCLRDIVNSSSHSLYNDEFGFANTGIVYPEICMYYLIKKH